MADRVRTNVQGNRPSAHWADLVPCAALTLLAGLAALAIPGGSPLRLLVTAPMLLFVPGYVLLQALFVPARPRSERLRHGIYALGLSPALAGLLALATALVPGGFTPGTIIAVLIAASLALAATAGLRRAGAASGPNASPVPAPVADAAEPVESDA